MINLQVVILRKKNDDSQMGEVNKVSSILFQNVQRYYGMFSYYDGMPLSVIMCTRHHLSSLRLYSSCRVKYFHYLHVHNLYYNRILLSTHHSTPHEWPKARYANNGDDRNGWDRWVGYMMIATDSRRRFKKKKELIPGVYVQQSCA